MGAAPVICLVAAVSRNGVIGNAGGMPWRVSSDLKYFKAVTMGKPMIMGRKTFDAVGRPLPGRANIVVTRQAGYAPDGVLVTGSLDEALRMAEEIAKRDGVDEIMVIGGGEIYAQSMPRAGRLYITELDLETDGDTRFPDIDPDQWTEVSREAHEAGENDSADYAFVVLDRA